MGVHKQDCSGLVAEKTAESKQETSEALGKAGPLQENCHGFLGQFELHYEFQTSLGNRVKGLHQTSKNPIKLGKR